MARNASRKPRNSLNQMSFLDTAPARGVRVKVAAERKSFIPVLARGEVLARHVEMGPEEFQAALDMSDIESKDRLEDDEVAIVDGIVADRVNEQWVPNGDTMIFDRRGGIIEGIKTALAGVRVDGVVRVLAVFGVDPEARFSTDDTLKTVQGRRNAFRTPVEIPAAPAPDLTRLRIHDRMDAARAFELRDRISASLGYDVLAHLTPEGLMAGQAFAQPIASRGFPRHVGLILHACLNEVAPGIVNDLRIAWVVGSNPRTGVGAVFANPEGKALGEIDLLTTLAVAAELHVDGLPLDPYAAKAASRRTQRQLLQVLFGRKGCLPDRLVSCGLEKLDEAAVRAALVAGGRPFESWTPTELARIEPLVRDVRRHRGLVVTGQTAKFSDGGVLIDGFDRLAACLVAGRPATTFVSRGFRKGFDHLRPRGRKQNLGHRLYADGYSYTWDIMSVMGNILRMSVQDRDVRYTNTSLRHMHHLHPQVQKIVMFVHGHKDYVNISALGAAHLAFSRYSRDLSDSFSYELLDFLKNGTAPTQPRHAVLPVLIDELKRIKVEGGDNDHTICILLQAMEAWCHERVVKRFAPLPEKGFYRMQTPPQVRELQEEAKRIRADRPENGQTAP